MHKEIKWLDQGHSKTVNRSGNRTQVTLGEILCCYSQVGQHRTHILEGLGWLLSFAAPGIIWMVLGGCLKLQQPIHDCLWATAVPQISALICGMDTFPGMLVLPWLSIPLHQDLWKGPQKIIYGSGVIWSIESPFMPPWPHSPVYQGLMMMRERQSHTF